MVTEKGSILSLYSIMIPVSDLERSLPFYRDILGLPVEYNPRRRGSLEFRIDDSSRIVIVSSDPSRCGVVVGITLLVDDLYSFYRKSTERGARYKGWIHRVEWGGVVATILDPDDNEVQLLDRRIISRWMMGA